MKAVFAIVALFVIGALAQGNLRPQLSDSFTATVDFQERHGHESRHFSGSWFMDYTGRQERFNAQTKRGLVDFFRFWNTSTAFGPLLLSFSDILANFCHAIADPDRVPAQVWCLQQANRPRQVLRCLRLDQVRQGERKLQADRWHWHGCRLEGLSRLSSPFF